MCPPPPIDPILPLGRVAGDLYVGRAELTDRIGRREQRDDEPGQHGGAHREHRGQDDDTAAETIEVVDAGTYDDHGRTSGVASTDTVDDLPHVDTSA